MTELVPFLMFQNSDAAEAMAFYTSLFPDDAVLSDQRYGPEGPGVEGTVVGRQVEAVEVAVGINQHGISLSLK